jgi:Tol biopolymer transport system component
MSRYITTLLFVGVARRRTIEDPAIQLSGPELIGKKDALMVKKRILLLVAMVGGLWSASVASSAQENRVAQLADEVGSKGWIVYAARSPENKTWDLYLMRPDGSQRCNITNTSDHEEGGPRFSPDGTQLLYRRFPKDTTIHHDLWGFQGRLIIAAADGTHPVEIGSDKEFPWASWSPDGRHIACLTLKGIQIVDLQTKETIRQLPRQGIYQQLFWSPDGQWFCGVANARVMWTVVRMNTQTGVLNIVHEFQSCTPDWFPDSQHIVFPSRPTGQEGYGFTQLWMSDGQGQETKMIYGEDGYHIYGGALSPDGQYVLFTRCCEDGGGSEKSGAPICVMRMADAPAVAGPSPALRKVHPHANVPTVLQLVDGWEPCWTYAEIGVK